MNITLIAACDLEYGIGYQGKLPWHLPADLSFFKQKTLSKSILMGRKTFDSIGKPLPGRRNWVLSHSMAVIPGVELIRNLDEIWHLDISEWMVIGGAQLYQLCLPYASKIILTQVQARFTVDRYFPRFASSGFSCVFEEYRAADEVNPYAMVFREYLREI